jgi:uncharacterized membrane protein
MTYHTDNIQNYSWFVKYIIAFSKDQLDLFDYSSEEEGVIILIDNRNLKIGITTQFFKAFYSAAYC